MKNLIKFILPFVLLAPSVAFAYNSVNAASKRVCVTPVVSVAAYSSANVVGTGAMNFANIFRNTGGFMTTITVSDKANQSANYELWLFYSNPAASTFTDKSAFVLNATDLLLAQGFFTINSTASASLVGVTEWQGGSQLSSANSNLYGVLVVRGTPTYASTSDVQVCITVSQD